MSSLTPDAAGTGSPFYANRKLATKALHPLGYAINALDLSSWDSRQGATALAILLLERVIRVESEVPGSMDIYLSRLEWDCPDICQGENNLLPLYHADSMLYGAYCLREYKHRGVARHIRNIFGVPEFTHG